MRVWSQRHIEELIKKTVKKMDLSADSGPDRNGVHIGAPIWAYQTANGTSLEYWVENDNEYCMQISGLNVLIQTLASNATIFVFPEYAPKPSASSTYGFMPSAETFMRTSLFGILSGEGYEVVEETWTGIKKDDVEPASYPTSSALTYVRSTPFQPSGVSLQNAFSHNPGLKVKSGVSATISGVVKIYIKIRSK